LNVLILLWVEAQSSSRNQRHSSDLHQ